MSTSELKKKIQSRVENADNKLLKMLDALLDTYESEGDVAGFTVEGDPITQSELKQRVKQAEQRIIKGEYQGQKDFRSIRE